MSFSAVLLAGGESRRMGRDKATLEWRGRRDPTITLDAREAERFREETGGGGVPMDSARRRGRKTG